MPTLTIHCRYPDDDEEEPGTRIAYSFDTLEEAEAARGAVLEQVRKGGEFYLPGDENGPMPFHAETVWGLTIR